jgi:hypothetical protein
VSQDFFFLFFRESSFPKPLIIALGSSQIFSKIPGDICKSRCNTGINDTVGKFATASVVDTGDKLTTGVNDTGSKFAAGDTPEVENLVALSL